jgi:uncharacterized protein YidB (DUF937 family)
MEGKTGTDPANPQRPGGGGLLEQVADRLGSGGGLGDILERFRNAGSGQHVDSWVGRGPNRSLYRQQVEAAIDLETIKELSRQTGLSREELLERIARDLPDAVDKMTPEGRLPDQAENSEPGEPTLLDPVPPRPQ